MTRTRALFAAAVFLAAAAPNTRADVRNTAVESKISHVTLYRSQALVMREVAVPDASSGEMALVIENLPPSVAPGSLFASSKDLKVRTVRHLTELLPEKPADDKVAQLEKRLVELAVAKAAVEARQAVQKTKKAYLDKLEAQYINKLGPSATGSGKDTKVEGFDFESIGKMTEFVFKQQELVTKQNLELADESRKLDDSIKDAQRQLEALRHGGARQKPVRDVVHKAIIYAAKSGAGKASLHLSYLVGNAGWTPAYNMRVNGEGGKLGLEYLAHVRQVTGEDWNGTTLTLSTATPNMNAELPLLAPMWVRLESAANKKPDSAAALSEADAFVSAPAPNAPVPSKSEALQLASKSVNPMVSNAAMQMGSIARYRQEKGGGSVDGIVTLNEGAWNRQSLEFRVAKEILRKWNEDVVKIEQQMAVEYKLPDTVTLASRDDNQMVQIFAESLDSSMYYEAAPLLAAYVSRGVEVKNTINQPLLAGEYSAFIDGQYVGSGQVPVTATGQTLVIGFGIDPQLRCRRELEDKSGDKSWGSRVEHYKYRLMLDNYKQSKVTVRLLDRIPVTKDKGLKITLTSGKDALSKDPDYVAADMPNGMLRWDVSVPGGSSGAKAFTLEYAFDMKFDADMRISGGEDRLREQLREDLQEMRLKKQRK